MEMTMQEAIRYVNKLALNTKEEALVYERVILQFYGRRSLKLLLIDNMDSRSTLLNLYETREDIRDEITTTITAIDATNKKIRKAMEILGS